MARTLTPIAELAQRNDPDISWRLNLPEYAPQAQIGINEPLIRRLAKLAGTGEFVIGTYGGEITTHLPSIDGLAPDGSATASGRATIQQAPLFKTNGADSLTPPIVGLNIDEMKDQLSRKKAGALRSPQAWSDILDTSLRQGINRALRETNINPASSAAFAVTQAISWPILHFEFNSDVLQTSGSLLALNLVLSAWTKKRGPQPHVNQAFNVSMFPFINLDRVLLAKTIGSLSRFVAPLK